MAQRKTKPPALPTEAEVDEITEQITTLPAATPQDLHSFLAEVFGEEEMPAPDPAEGELPSKLWIKQHFKSKSAAIRYLINKGFDRKRIASLLNVKYQHVRNVQMTPLKRGPNEPWNITKTDGDKT